jgi:hypothetical protein
MPADERLLARPRIKEALVRQLRDCLHQICHALGLSTRIVRTSFGTIPSAGLLLSDWRPVAFKPK